VATVQTSLSSITEMLLPYATRINKRIMKAPIGILALSAVATAVIGCGGGASTGGTVAPDSQGGTTASASATYTPKNVLAGLPVDKSTDSKPYAQLVAASVKYGHRADPFQLTSEETAYDKQQNVERVLGTLGGFTTQYTVPPEESKDVEPQEPQPYRRLAGIIVGDSVLGIIDMGDGRATTIIRPGMKIPNTEWTVVSINEDRALLHRDGNVGPHTISVRLEEPPFGASTGFGGQTQNGPPSRPGGGGGPRMGIGGTGGPGNGAG